VTTPAAGIVPDPVAGQPFTTVGAGGWTIALAADVAAVEPALLLALTVTRSVAPASTWLSLYVFATAPLIAAQRLPVSSQRLQATAYPAGLPSHDPFTAVRIDPTCGVPVIVGARVIAGAAAAETIAVGADVEDADPSAFVAVTVTRRVRPTSAAAAVYVSAVTPAIAVQASPFESQRDHA
jgi:hypothetical protein